MAPHRVLRQPPVQQGVERLPRGADGPVELRGEVIHPAALQPEARVGVELVPGVEPRHAGGEPRAPDPKRRNADAHPRLALLDLAVHPLHEAVDVLAAPVAAGQRPAAARVAGIGRVVGKDEGAVAVRIRIEEVVDVEGVDVVALHHVVHDGDGVVLHVLLAGIEPEADAVAGDAVARDAPEVGAEGGEVRGSEARRVAGVAGAEGVEPGMHLEAAGARRVDRQLQRVVAGVHVGAPGEGGGPRFGAAGVQALAVHAHLEDHGVGAELRRPVEKGNQLGALLGGGQRGARRPVEVGHRRDPDAPELTKDARDGEGRVARRGRRGGGSGTGGRVVA